MANSTSSAFSANGSYSIDRYTAATGPAQRPVTVIFHGVDGMVGESDTEIRKLAAQIAEDGYLVFLPHYLGSAGTAMPSKEVLAQRTSQVKNYRPIVSAAVDYALAQPGVDATRLGLVGLSLGGGLALWYAESAPRGKVKAVVDFFGHIGDPMIYSNAGQLPPTLVFHHHDDGIVGASGSEQLISALKQNGVVHDGEIYGKDGKDKYPERWNHNFRPGGNADIDSRARTLKWLATHVKS